MRLLQYFILAIILLASCTPSSNMKTLNDVDAIIEGRPDSALTVLRGMDTSSFSKSEKAKYALLISMAFDKNYTDTTTFDVLQPAIEYYYKHGSDVDRMRTLYYKGRIYANKGDYASATSCYMNALDCGNESENTFLRARLCVSIGVMYKNMYRWNESKEQYVKASKYYRKCGRIDREFRCYIRAIGNCIQLKDSVEGDKFIATCNSMRPQIKDSILLGDYFEEVLVYAASVKHSTCRIEDALHEYYSNVPEGRWNLLSLSVACYFAEDYEKALDYLDRYNIDDATDARAINRYYAIKSKVLEKVGRYAEAFEAQQTHYNLEDSISILSTRQEALLVENAHNIELQKVKDVAERNQYIYVLAICLILMLLAFVWVRYKLVLNRTKNRLMESEAEQLRLRYFELENEYNDLKSIPNINSLDDSVKEALNDRTELLNKFLKSYISGNSDLGEKFYKEMNSLLANREEFMKTTRLSFVASHPDFIKYLQEHDLTDEEINICCLYAIGLNGKEVGAFINRKGHYNISSAIREKLGIGEHDNILSIYIRKLL
jgi:tetratricopeptide (TPR) repeat protein